MEKLKEWVRKIVRERRIQLSKLAGIIRGNVSLNPPFFISINYFKHLKFGGKCPKYNVKPNRINLLK